MLLGGFDLVPEVLQQMQTGYVQVQVDQQPYMQGFMPVMEVYLTKKIGLAPADIDTGQGIVRPDQADAIMKLLFHRDCANCAVQMRSFASAARGAADASWKSRTAGA